MCHELTLGRQQLISATPQQNEVEIALIAETAGCFSVSFLLLLVIEPPPKFSKMNIDRNDRLK